MTEQEILDLFVDTKSKLSGHFILASGKHSSTYMQCARLFMYPQTSKKICSVLYNKLKGESIDFVASPAIGGVIMGYEMSAQAGVPNIFFERVDGAMTLRRGFNVVPNARYLVVEDVVTTGGSVLEVCSEIIKAGGIVACVAAVVDRSTKPVEFNAPFYSLLKTEIIAYDAAQCPLCEQGIEAIKPGTRALLQK